MYGSVRRLITRRLTFFAHDSFGHLPTTDDVELNGVPFRRIGSRTNGGEAGIEARLTKYTDLSVRYENTWIRFDRPELFLTDGWVNGVHAELSRRLSERLSAGAEYGFRLADLNEGTHQVQFQDVGGTLHYHVGSATTLSLAAGVSHLDDRLVLVTRTGPYVRANVTHEVERATVGRASSARMSRRSAWRIHAEPGDPRIRPDAARQEPALRAGLGGMAPQRSIHCE